MNIASPSEEGGNKAPKTVDNGTIFLWLGILLASGSALATVKNKKKKIIDGK